MEALKLPGTEVRWKRRYEEVMKMMEEVDMEEWIWRGVQVLGAPGSKEQWRKVVQKAREKFTKLKKWVLE